MERNPEKENPIDAGPSGRNQKDRPQTNPKYGKHTGLKFQPKVKRETVCKPFNFNHPIPKQKPEQPAQLILQTPMNQGIKDEEIIHLKKIDKFQSRVEKDVIKIPKEVASPLPKALRELEGRVVQTISTHLMETDRLKVKVTFSVETSDAGATTTATLCNRRPQPVAHSGMRFLPKAKPKPFKKLIRPDLKENIEKPIKEENTIQELFEKNPAKISERRNAYREK